MTNSSGGNMANSPNGFRSTKFYGYFTPFILVLLAISVAALLWLIDIKRLVDGDLSIQPATTTVYLVRHAEKEINSGKDPALTDQGKFRANFLAKMLDKIPIDAVYSTDTIRTRETAGPTAQSQGKEVRIYDALEVDYAGFLENNHAKTVLVVGHSNTIPAFVNGLLGKQKYAELDESEYDNLFVVDIIGQRKSDKLLTIAARLGDAEPLEQKSMPQHEKINYLEYAAKDIEATKAFFSKTFGWTFEDYGPDYAAFENQGVNGGFYRADKSSSVAKGAALTVFYSKALEATESKVVAAGGVISTAIFDFPGGRRFHFIEPSGNEFAVWGE
ncbi:MAG: putative enzyme related to lactoylglutathione lyase/broad specificity phosphatase PhoE [Arenicella sp.]|jgi:predicted enzyme related to lactoylglutathione lyase/broad specificity phosphatase PhoE